MIRILIVLTLMLPAVASAKSLGVVGKVYSFAEKDALAEIEARARAVDWSKQLALLKREVVRYRPAAPSLPKVVANRTRLVKPVYTLDVDVPDPRDVSRVLYPKGFTFNPFQYMALPGCVVFMSAADEKQVAWLKKSRFADDATARVLLTGGDIEKMEQYFYRQFFYADDTLVERFDILAVPSAACQKGVDLEIHEYLP